MCARFDELGDEARQEVLTRWQRQDAHSHGGRAHIAGLAPERVALHGSYLDERWARVMNLIVHAEDPLRPRLPAPYTLDVCAKVLMTELNLRQARPDLLPDESHAGFDLAHFYEWSTDELLAMSRRLGLMMSARSLLKQDRRAMARRLHALSLEARNTVMQDMKADFECDDALIKRCDEVVIALQKRSYESVEALLTSLGLYLFAIAAGRRLAARALNLADRLPQPFASDLHGFVRQHRTSSRRGLEPLAAQVIEQLLDHLALTSSTPGAPS